MNQQEYLNYLMQMQQKQQSDYARRQQENMANWNNSFGIKSQEVVKPQKDLSKYHSDITDAEFEFIPHKKLLPQIK